ncbi:uncharacterized protein LOC124607133 isoform X2 [Schistocerca americana]|uniref:uncharacterized protein LOC124607133 isoform X2 n=1 Tax=Schistocerca americana TaxID=7009 RepID=UPI001F4F749E|nr:uncharacterized protein LOC124607133 isoform X2 [Schistocerca americana]
MVRGFLHCCCRCFCRCCPGWLRECEARCCAILAIVTFSLAVTSFAVFTDSAFLAMSAHPHSAVCILHSYRRLSGSSLCQWTSCRASCTAAFYNCTQITVEYALGHPQTGENETNEYLNNTLLPLTKVSSNLSNGIPVERWNVSMPSTKKNLTFINMTAAAGNFTLSGASDIMNNLTRERKSTNYAVTTSDYHVGTWRNYSQDEMVKNASEYNSSHVLPLFVNLFGCGYEPEDLCRHFYHAYSEVGLVFPCLIFVDMGPPFAVPDPQADKYVSVGDPLRDFFLSLLPAFTCLCCAIYIHMRRLFQLKPQNKNEQNSVNIKKLKRNSIAPKNFYERRMMEMDIKWQHKPKVSTPLECRSICSSVEPDKLKKSASRDDTRRPAFIKVPPADAVPRAQAGPVDHEQFL